MITRDVVTETLARIVAEAPDGAAHVDESSGRYVVEDGQPGCIIGHLVAALDVEVFELMVKEPDAYNFYGFGEIYGDAEKFDPETFHALGRLQAYQDNGDPWGEAVRAVGLSHE